MHLDTGITFLHRHMDKMINKVVKNVGQILEKSWKKSWSEVSKSPGLIEMLFMLTIDTINYTLNPFDDIFHFIYLHYRNN